MSVGSACTPTCLDLQAGGVDQHHRHLDNLVQPAHSAILHTCGLKVKHRIVRELGAAPPGSGALLGSDSARKLCFRNRRHDLGQLVLVRLELVLEVQVLEGEIGFDALAPARLVVEVHIGASFTLLGCMLSVVCEAVARC